jgi:hypothetical protein
MNRALAPEPLQLLLLAGRVSVWIPAVDADEAVAELSTVAALLHK